MKRLLTGVVVAILVLAMAGSSFAAGASDVKVQATVLGKCNYSLPAVGATTITLADLDPSLAVPPAVTGTTTMAAAAKCTKGQAITVNLGLGGNGANNMISGTGDLIAYTPASSCAQGGAPVACTGQGFGAAAAIDLKIDVTVAAGTYDVPVGLYTDTFTVDLLP